MGMFGAGHHDIIHVGFGVFTHGGEAGLRRRGFDHRGGGRQLHKVSNAGDNAGEVDASVEGGEMQIAFNGRYLRDALEAIDTSQVGLEIMGPTNPGVIKPVGETNGYLHVIMPMQVNQRS